MKFLLLSDTHFSDRSRDAFKFGIFDWLLKQKSKYDVGVTIFAGDLTEFKDRHPAILVNKIVEGLESLVDMYHSTSVYVLRANHDCISPDDPFFKFLNLSNKINFINHPRILCLEKSVVAIPHCRTQEEFNKSCSMIEDGNGSIVHQTFEGAIAETGAFMTGIKWPLKAKPAWTYSGDIHKPQKVGHIVYIGSPWHNRYGDNFQPRVLLVESNTGKSEDLYFPTPKKWVLKIRNAKEIVKDQMLTAGDHVRVELQLTREELVEWPKHKEQVLKACQVRKLEVFGVELKVPEPAKREKVEVKVGTTNEQVFNEFCLAENVPSVIKEVGHGIIGKHEPK